MSTSTSLLSVLCLNICLFVFLPTEVEFNVSEAFVPLATPNSNHSPHTGNEAESGTLERKRPASMAVMEGDLVKKERYVQWEALPDLADAPRRWATLSAWVYSRRMAPVLP